jgi:hypothetical protein
VVVEAEEVLEDSVAVAVAAEDSVVIAVAAEGSAVDAEAVEDSVVIAVAVEVAVEDSAVIAVAAVDLVAGEDSVVIAAEAVDSADEVVTRVEDPPNAQDKSFQVQHSQLQRSLETITKGGSWALASSFPLTWLLW